MSAVARGNGKDYVLSKTGLGKGCSQPMITKTSECSSDVFVNGIGVVREGDKVTIHNKNGCIPDESVLSKGSSKVFVNRKPVGRIGDQYTPDNIIISGSPTVFCG